MKRIQHPADQVALEAATISASNLGGKVKQVTANSYGVIVGGICVEKHFVANAPRRDWAADKAKDDAAKARWVAAGSPSHLPYHIF